MNSKELITLLKKHGLRLATKRRLSLFALSAVSWGYGSSFKKNLGFSFPVGGLGKAGEWEFFLNEEYIAKQTDELVRQGRTEKVLAKAWKTYLKARADLQEKGLNPDDFLRKLIKSYPLYMESIGTYNCFWRYIGNAPEKTRLTQELIKKISGEREEIAKLYPEIEQKLVAQTQGKREIFRLMTKNELEDHLVKKKQIEWKKIEKRREGFFYLFIEDKEEVFTEKKILEAIKKEFYQIERLTGTVTGHCVYPGKVVGRVFTPNSKGGGEILVTNMTQPHEVALVKRCKAVVTDEGGVLSHVSVLARELKKPCVIGTRFATKVFKEGDLVEVNADKGIVKILKKVL